MPTVRLYVSPNGNGGGSSANSPASYTASNFWANVQTQLSSEAVVVRFQNGLYGSPLPLPAGTGNPDHALILEGQSSGGVVFRVADDARPQDDIDCVSPDRDLQPERIRFENCRNITLQSFVFTGQGTIGYVVRLLGRTQNVAIEDCAFDDLPRVVYGATGVHGGHRFDVHHITYRACRFRAVGCDSYAHMMYHAYDARHIRVFDCAFEDCAGDYVRFRDKVDQCVVHNCTFTSSGSFPKETPKNRFFVAMPLFNDCNPELTGAERCATIQYEYFGTNYVISSNRFSYQHDPDKGNRYAIVFYHVGYDPPGRHHLMTQAEGAVLLLGANEARKALLKKNCGIDGDQVKVYGNQYDHVEKRVAFGSHADYGAASKGWEGYADMTGVVNDDRVLDPPRWIEAVLRLSSLSKG